MKDTFLSIDLDFWSNVTPKMLEFIKEVNRLKVPKLIANEHHHILPFVNKHPSKVLMNIDYHSDLAEDNLSDVNCGTWANHVKWRLKSHYIWVCPNRRDCYVKGNGRCDTGRDFPGDPTDPFGKRLSTWKYTTVKTGLQWVNLSRVKAVAYAVSPDYVEWLDAGWKTPHQKLSTVLKFPPTWLSDYVKYKYIIRGKAVVF